MSYFDDASLAFLPSGGAGKDGKAYSIKPTDGTGDFTFSRGSNLTATRVGPTGLIEKGRENLLLRSNAFDTTWTTSNASVTSGQSGYDGTSDAWELTKVGNAEGYIKYESHSVSGVNTISIYAKESASSWIYIFADTIGGYYFDLRPSTTGSRIGTEVLSGAIDGSAFVEDIGNDWFRVGFSWSGSNSRIRITPAEGDGQRTDTSGSIYIQDAQLEVGLAATDYIESGASTGKAGLLENEPRFDYSGGATCGSLLLEPSRTNLLPYSEYFDGSGWALSAATATLGQTSPEGVNNAYRFTTTASTNPYLRVQPSATGTTYVHGVFAKYVDSQYIYVGGLGRNANENEGYVSFDIQNGAKGQVISGSHNDFDIINIGNGWYYCWVSRTYSGTQLNVEHRFGVTDSPTSLTFYVGKSVDIYGAQLEQASYPTSYIPNHSGGSVTRGAELCELSKGGVNETEGTFFIDYGNSSNVNALFASSTSNNTITNNIRLSQGQLYIRNGGGNLIIASVTTPDSGKLALKYSTNGVKIFANGGSTPIYESTTPITFDGPIDYVRVGSRVNDAGVEEFKPKQFLIFQEALSDADCIALTTL